MKFTLSLPAIVFVSGCAMNEPTPQTTYYLLDPHPAATNTTLEHTRIRVAPILLPDYLKQPNLVMREETNELRLANYHSWADNLGDAIQRVVISESNQLTNAYSFVAHCGVCDTVSISVEHFYPTRGGQVVLAGSFEVAAAGGRAGTSLVRQFSFASPLEKEGYDNAVEQLRQLLTRLSQDIVNQLAVIQSPVSSSATPQPRQSPEGY